MGGLAQTLQGCSCDQTHEGGQAMTHHTPKLTDQAVLVQARTCLQERLPLPADGYTCTTADLLNVLLGGAVTRGTIESVCADLAGAPDQNTIRHDLNTQLRPDDLDLLEEHVNGHWPTWCRNGSGRRRGMWPWPSMIGPPTARPRKRRACGCEAKPRRAPHASTASRPPMSCSSTCASPWPSALFVPTLTRSAWSTACCSA